MSEGFLSCSTSCTDADVTVSSEKTMERVSSREKEVAQNVLMTCMAKLQDALQEAVVAISDVIREQASEMQKIQGVRLALFSLNFEPFFPVF